MTPNNLDEQLTKYLTDAHSIEQQALAQMRLAPRIAGREQIARVFSEHLRETQEHDRRVVERLAARGASPSKLKGVVGAATGVGFGLFAMAQPDTPGKLVVHAFSYEHMEAAAYDLMARVAERAGDESTLAAAREIGDQERAMAERVAGCFDVAVDASFEQKNPSDTGKQLGRYLTDAHAIEVQALQLLQRAPKLAGSPELAAAYESHRSETEEHRRLIDGRLSARGESPSKLKDGALRLGALNWGFFFQAQPDTPAKLAGFSYAFEHLEIASYEMLSRAATRVGDQETVEVAQRILAEERAAAERLHSLFDAALDVTLAERGVGVA